MEPRGTKIMIRIKGETSSSPRVRDWNTALTDAAQWRQHGLGARGLLGGDTILHRTTVAILFSTLRGCLSKGTSPTALLTQARDRLTG